MVSLSLFLFLIIAIELYINTHYLEIKNNEIYIYQGIINKKLIHIKKDLLHELILEKNPYLYLLNLSNLKLRTFEREYEILGIEANREVLKLMKKFKFSKNQEHF